MSWFKNLFSNGTASAVDAIGNAIDKVVTSDDERNQAAIIMERLKQQPGLAQVELNKIEAASRSLWVAGWRPFIGWVCGVSIALYFIPKFLLAAIVWVVAIDASEWTKIPTYPVEAKALFELVFALLGMATLRTVEKAKGLTK